MQEPTAAQVSVEERVVVDQVEQGGVDEETATSAILRAVQGSATLQLEDVLASLRRSRCRLPSPSTTTDDPTSDADHHGYAEHHNAPHELAALWWWLFASKGENACLAFLAGYDDSDNALRARATQKATRTSHRRVCGGAAKTGAGLPPRGSSADGWPQPQKEKKREGYYRLQIGIR
jgi:hypothetical protein